MKRGDNYYCDQCGDEIPRINRNGNTIPDYRRAERKVCDKKDCRGAVLAKEIRMKRANNGVYTIPQTPINRFILGYD